MADRETTSYNPKSAVSIKLTIDELLAAYEKLIDSRDERIAELEAEIKELKEMSNG